MLYSGEGQEEVYGRARVHQQWGDDADAVQEAIETCPVDCIYYVRACLPCLPRLKSQMK